MKKSELKQIIRECVTEVKDTTLLKENKQEFVTDDRFKTIAQLHTYIENNVAKSLNKMLSAIGINAKITAKIDQHRGESRIRIKSKVFSGTDLGLFQYCMSRVEFVFFGAGTINIKETENGIEYIPLVWCSLNLDYDHIDGGSNGSSFVFPGERNSHLWFDIKTGKMLKESEAITAFGEK